jgi:hypothetical protein
MIKDFLRTLVTMKSDIDEYQELRSEYRKLLFNIHISSLLKTHEYDTIESFCKEKGYPVPDISEYSVDEPKKVKAINILEKIEKKFPEQKKNTLNFLRKATSWNDVKHIHIMLHEQVNKKG